MPGPEKLRHAIIGTRDFERTKTRVPPEERAGCEFRIVRKTLDHFRAFALAGGAADDRPCVSVLAEFRAAGPIEVESLPFIPKALMQPGTQATRLRSELNRIALVSEQLGEIRRFIQSHNIM